MSLHFSRNLILGASLSTTLLSVLTSCQDEEFGHAADEIKYAKNFTQVYGEIPADKSWDLSTYGYHYESGQNATRAGGNADLIAYYDDGASDATSHFVKKGWWEVPKKSLDWLEKALVEGKDNRYLGSNFILQLPANDFAIIPIYQGRSGINNELEIKINGYNIKKVWGRTEDILVNDRTLTAEQAKSLPGAAYITESNIKDGNNVWDSETHKYVSDNKWHTVGYYNGVANPSTPDYDVTNGRGVNKAASGEPEFYVYPKYPNYTDEAHRIMTKPIYFRKDKISSGNPFMYLSLHNIGKQVIKVENGEKKIWDTNIWVEKGANVWTTVGNRLTSINPEKRMLALNIPSANRPSAADLPDIHEGGSSHQMPSQVLVIACEDADGPSTDNDINDVVFMIVGYPNAPTVIPTNEIVKKRYMCEDLGATDDFDFNDIVVDVTQEKKYELVTEPVGKEGDSFNDIQNPGTATGVEISQMREIPGSTKQWAKITHVCGTLPLQVQVGNYMFPKIQDPTDQYATRDALKGPGEFLTPIDTRATGEKIGWNPNEEKLISDNSWDPNTNNIKIYVDWSKSKAPALALRVDGKVNNPYPETNSNFADFANGNKVVVNFPKPGEVPYIIATDQDVPWMKERQDIPEEWVTTGDISARNGNQADPGYGMYMENYNAGDGQRMEVAIWSGRVTGMASTTGVVLAPGSAEILGIAAAGDGYKDLDPLAEGTKNPEAHYYKILKVYTEPLASGQLGAIGLRMDDGNGNWIPLTTAQPDAYYQGTLEDNSYGYGVEGLYCTEIYLTNEQYNLIVGNDSGRNGKGLIVTSETNGLVIRKISMDRSLVGTSLDPGYIVNLTKPTNGSIKSLNHRERRANISNGMSDSDKATELSRVCVPYDQTRYKKGDSFTLTAVGSKGYALKNWIVDSSTAGSDNPKTFTFNDNAAHTISAEFESVTDPRLFFSGDKTSVDLTIARGTTYSLVASSLNWSNKVEFYGHDASIVTLSTANRDINGSKHVVDIVGNAVGNTSFVIYLKDGYTGVTRYGVSDELKVNVSVVEKPVATVELNAAKFHQWDKYDDPTCVITGRGNIAGSLNTTVQSHDTQTWCTTVLGSTYNDSYEYADLNRSNYLVITLAEGSGLPRFFFNKYANDETDEFRKNTMAVDFRADNRTYVSFAQNSDGTTTYWVDLKKVRADHGYCSNLNAITTDYGSMNGGTLTRSNANIISAYVDYYECPAESSNKITVTAVNGSATANGEASVNITSGNTVRLQATANTIPDGEAANHRYEFDGWYNGSTKLSGNEDYTFTPSASMNIEARYTSLWRFRSNIIGSGYVNVHYKDQWNGMNELFIPVGETVEITAVGQNSNEFITWGWTDQNPRNVTVEEGATKNNPTATFGEVVTSEARDIRYWSNNDGSNQTYTVSLTDLKNELFKNGKKSLCIKLDSRVKTMNLQLGWDTQVKSNIEVKDGVAKITFESDEINTITSSESDLFLHVINPATTSENLTDAKITKILRY